VAAPVYSRLMSGVLPLFNIVPDDAEFRVANPAAFTSVSTRVPAVGT